MYWLAVLYLRFACCVSCVPIDGMADNFHEETDQNNQLLQTINKMITIIHEECTDWACNTKSYPKSAVLSVQVSLPAGPRGEGAC